MFASCTVRLSISAPFMHLSGLLLALLLLAPPVASTAQTCASNFALTLQAEVDAFDCTTVTGELRIGGADISNLDGLSELSVIGGRLYIYETAGLQNTNGLGALTSIGGGLHVVNNAQLTSLSGLSTLSSLGGGLIVEGNEALVSLDGLEGIPSADGVLIVRNNASLEDLDGLAGVTSVSGFLVISMNDALTNIDGLATLSRVGTSVAVHSNSSLLNLDGFASLDRVNTDFYIFRNDALANIDGLSGISSVGEELSIGDNPMLTDLNGLSALVSVGGFLEVYNHAALTDLDGLSALTTVGSSLYIAGNDVLGNVDGLAAVQSIGEFVGNGLFLQENPFLSRCSIGVGPIVAADQTAPNTILGPIAISNNAPDGDCTSAQSVLDAYLALPAEDAPALAAPLAVFPNPAAARATFSFALADAADATLVVYDALGREVARLHDGPAHGSETITLDAGALPAGLYVARLTAGERVETARLTVLR